MEATFFYYFCRMEQEIRESYELLLAVCRTEDTRLNDGYKLLRDLLERCCRTLIQDESLQMTDLAARISFVAARLGLSPAEQNRLHTFRLTSNHILNKRETPTREHLLRDTKTLAFFLRKLSGEEIPPELYRLLPRADATYVVSPPIREERQRIRVCFQYADEQYLYVTPVDEVTDTPWKVRYNVPDINQEFATTCDQLWRYAQLNLLDVAIDDEGILTPSFMVLEPDYLLDISSLAECFKAYGHHPANYWLARLQPSENTRPLLLGNIANLFLDEWIHTEGEVDYRTSMQKAFRRYPIELAACADLQDKEKEGEFFNDCRKHFDHIRQVVKETFQLPGYELDKTDAVLEPAYICEALGLQGRLDYMQRDMSSFIEMKSGKADEYAIKGKVEPQENHKVQMLLYQAVLQYSMGKDHRTGKPYLLYTRYPLLYPARSSWAMVRRAIDLRNRIVAGEYGIQLRNSTHYTAEKLSEINPDVLNERKLKGVLWQRYLEPGIRQWRENTDKLSELEQAYFYTLYNFITKELYTSKSGDADYEGRTGAAALWLSTYTEKLEAGEIISGLHIYESHAANEHKAGLVLERTTEPAEGEALPNFRQGDAIVLYEHLSEADNVTHKMVFKGNIESITECRVAVRLRATQQNPSVLSETSLYAIEHDTMDTTFRAMFQGLTAFCTANQERRDLLLGQRAPRFEANISEAPEADDFTRIAQKAEAAKDYFLLIGPPGTGKTSCALKRMVETFHQQPDKQILLLSYTNRAVDEICKALTRVKPGVDFIRIGSELSCEEAYREYLIENVLAACNRRSEVTDRMNRCRIFVGTVASIAGKPELFRLKQFDVAIIDEASQILEPQLLGLLCARTPSGKDAIGKFILIGDHKQLPAVVQQRPEQSAVYDEQLLNIGLQNVRDSLFERLYRTSSQYPEAFDMLCKQGRMHPEVAHFANHTFYEGKLEAVGLPHQLEDPEACCRLAFFPSAPQPAGTPAKSNRHEARIVAQLAAETYQTYGEEFDASSSLGIITPYRSQIALIRKEIAGLGIPALNEILIDTVERFQGSERNVIIYSCCVNYPYQLKFLSNMTEENGFLIDRKLNVAMTRARKQLYITGNPELLNCHPIYRTLLNSTTKERILKDGIC